MQSQVKRAEIVISKKKISLKKILIVGIFALLLFSGCWSFFWSILSLQSIKSGNLTAANSDAKLASPPVYFLSVITFGKSNSIELWQTTLTLIQQANAFEVTLQ